MLVNETLSTKTRHVHIGTEIREAIISLLVPSLVMSDFTLLFAFWAISWITHPQPMYSHSEEIVDATTSLNQLFSHPERTIQRIQLLTSDTAPELCIPLAGIRLHLALMAQNGESQAPGLIQRIDPLIHTIEQRLCLLVQNKRWQADTTMPLVGYRTPLHR